MHRFTAALLVSVLAACGDNVRGGYEAGKRLAPYGEIFEDGTTLPHADRFFDLERGEDCTLQAWADGARYCTPAASPFVFADRFCRKPIMKVDPDAPVRYAEVPFVAPDGTTYVSRLRPLGASIGHVPYYRPIVGDCVGPSDDPDASYVEVTATELDEGDFVQVTRTLDEIDDRLSAVRLTGQDGLSLPIGFLDRSEGFDCTGDGSPDVETPTHRPTPASCCMRPGQRSTILRSAARPSRQ